MPDFADEHSDPVAFLNCVYARAIVHTDVYSIDNMTDRELRESIVEDILAVTIWEKQYNQQLHFGFSNFFKFIMRSQYKRVLKQMKDPEISGILNIKRNRDNSGSELRIKDDKQILQSAMDYCGNWYTGFKMPSDAICINRQKINEMGGFEKVAELVATEYLIEKNSTHKGNDTLN